MKTSQKAARDWSTLSLWPNQREAIAFALGYLNAGESRAALVQMPTGTGKTGVMAVVASLLLPSQSVIVLSPSAAVTQQLIADISGAFWNKIGADRSWIPPAVTHLLPSSRTHLIEDLSKKNHVLIGTIQSLEQIASDDDPKFYGALQQYGGVVFIDEGHREPAREWAEAVRGLQKPSILFSATPYRSDLNLFNVSDDYVSFLSFREGVDLNIVRDVDFDDLGADQNAQAFVGALVKKYERWRSDGDIANDAKVIVRAASKSTVDALHAAFKRRLKNTQIGFLAVHDRYKSNGGTKLHAVPKDLRVRDEVFLIHQYKLMEGIDDPRCSVLAVYENFTNERQLVQQVGRVIRHPAPLKDEAKPALIVGNQIDSIRRMWSGFEDYESTCAANGRKPPIRNSDEVVERILGAFPQADFVGGSFRRRKAFHDLMGEDLALAKTCVIGRTQPHFTFSKFVDFVKREMEVGDRILKRESIDASAQTGWMLSVSVTQSPLLPTNLFADFRLEATAFAVNGEYVFFHDTAGLSFREFRDVDRIGTLEIRGLLPEQSSTRITALSLLNADIGPAAIRSRSFTATSLADSVPFMGDHLNFVSRAMGRVNGKSRYIGLTRGRVREGDIPALTASEFFNWTSEVASELRKLNDPVALFSRFAWPVAVPSSTDPVNILLDVAELKSSFIGPEKAILDFSDVDICYNITQQPEDEAGFGHAFTAALPSGDAEVLIKFDAKRKRYVLQSDDLDEYLDSKTERSVTLTKRLNQSQAFRIIPEAPSVVYAHRQFYSVDLRLKGTNAGQIILDLLTPVTRLGTTKEEKGQAVGRLKNWPDGSLFNLLSNELSASAAKSLFGTRFSGLVCDDLGDEAADFIGIQEDPPRVVFVHAKTSEKGYKLAASALYDVCGQAIKNLAYLRFGAEKFPGSSNKWNHDWKLDDMVVESRIRCGPSTAGLFREAFRSLIGNPNTRREVWLCLGNLLSRARLADAIRRGSVDPSLIQSYYLIMSTYGACKSVGVDLRIFCSE